MRHLARNCSAIVIALAAAFVPATAASAKSQPTAKVAKWAKKNHLKGTWRTKDADRDGIKNLAEFKLGTNPRKADSDRDGLRDGDEIKVGDDPLKADTDGDKIKDGAEHAGVVTAFDGDTVTIRQFKGGTLTGTISEDTDCYAAEPPSSDDTTTGDDTTGDSSDDGYWGDDTGDDGATDDSGDTTGDDPGADTSTVDDDPTSVDVGDDPSADGSAAGADPATCGDAGVAKGAVVRSVEVERDGSQLVLTAVELAN